MRRKDRRLELPRITEHSLEGIDKIVLFAAHKFIEYRGQVESELYDKLAARRAKRLIAEVHLISKVLDNVVPIENDSWFEQIQDRAAQEEANKPVA